MPSSTKWRKLTPKFCVIWIIATFTPIAYITIVDLLYSHTVDQPPPELAAMKAYHVQQLIEIANSNTSGRIALIAKNSADKDKGLELIKGHAHSLGKEGNSRKNDTRYILKTHTNSSAVLGAAERKARLCSLLPKRLGKTFQ